MLKFVLQYLFPVKKMYDTPPLKIRSIPLESIFLRKAELQTLGLEHLDQLTAVASYHDSAQLQQWIKDCKYKEDTKKIDTLTQVIAPIVQAQVPTDFVLCAVPMHWWRQWHRGFNQAELLAHTISVHTYHHCLQPLRKKFSFGHQARRNRAKRLAALKNTIVAQAVVPKNICLIDDVCTTGATLNECARILKENGAVQVIACTILYSKPCETNPTFVD